MAFDRFRLAGGRERDVAGSLAHRPDMFEQFLTGLGQFQRTPNPLEQRDAEFGLERRDLAAERRLCEAERTGGSGQRA